MKHRRNHSLRDVVAKFLDLLPDVLHEGITRPSSDKHDHENGAASNEHCHGTTRSDRVGSYFGRLDVQHIFADHSNRVLQCARHLL